MRGEMWLAARPALLRAPMHPCLKIAYPSPRAAALAMHHITARQTARGRTAPVAVHWCEGCHAWHLTSKRASGRWARRLQMLAGIDADHRVVITDLRRGAPVQPTTQASRTLSPSSGPCSLGTQTLTTLTGGVG